MARRRSAPEQQDPPAPLVQALIEGILEVHDRLDLDWIRTRLAEFDQALGQTDVLDGFDGILARIHRSTAPGDSVG